MQDINNFNIRNVIDNVFNKLNENAIHAKQNYFVTASPGLSSLIAEAENINGKIGVAFYTEQLTKYAEKHGELYIYYKSINDDDDITKEVGDIICNVFRKNGLEVTWDENIYNTICVSVLNWVKRENDYDPK